MNMEDMKKEAEMQYAIREFNNAIQSAKASNTDLQTSRTLVNSMHYMPGCDTIVIHSAGMDCYIQNPIASENGWHISIGHGNFAIVKPETVLGWLEQLQKD